MTRLAARSKAWVCGRLPAGIVSSNPSVVFDIGEHWKENVLSLPFVLMKLNFGIYVRNYTTSLSRKQ